MEGPRNAIEAVATQHAAAFPRLATPSLTPGVDESPFMTWGEVEGTPLRLDMEDDVALRPEDPHAPHFRIKELPKRDQCVPTSFQATVSVAACPVLYCSDIFGKSPLMNCLLCVRAVLRHTFGRKWRGNIHGSARGCVCAWRV